MENKKDRRWQMVLIIVCLCFFAGIVTGAVSLTETDAEKTVKIIELVGENTRECSAFGILYMKRIKYILAMWFSAFFGAGIALILVIMFSTGIMYGFSSAFIAAQKGMEKIVHCILPQNLFILPIYIFMALWSVNFVLNGFTDYGPKSRLKREREKHITEHIIILLTAMAVTAVGCFLELHTSYVSF